VSLTKGYYGDPLPQHDATADDARAAVGAFQRRSGPALFLSFPPDLIRGKDDGSKRPGFMRPICPHCGHRFFSLWYKMIPGPVRSVPCGWCGQKIGLKARPALAAAAPAAIFLALGFGHMIVQRDSLIWGAVITGLAAFAIYLFVPLKKRRVTDVAALEQRRGRVGGKGRQGLSGSPAFQLASALLAP